MRLRLPRWSSLLVAVLVLAPLVVWARAGGGEHYSSSHSYGSGSHGGGDDASGFILWLLIRLCLEHPVIGIPLLIVFAIGYTMYQRNTNPGRRTQRALDRAEGASRTRIQQGASSGWENALRLKDPDFRRPMLYAHARELFAQVQEAWFQRDLSKVRPFLSDATYQRLTAQLELLDSQGVRDAITDVEVRDVAMIGLEQNEFFDTVHLRITASTRDTDVLATTSDEDARAAARKAAPEQFIEIWSFVRKPGAKTRMAQDVAHGKCPNCGAPFSGGATNNCEFCKAVVNSGNYDWTLAEITQSVEYVPGHTRVDGLMQARASDEALNLEMLEDRASLVFWKWIRAQSHHEPREMMKLATPTFVQSLQTEFKRLDSQRMRRVFLECAVGGVNTRLLRNNVDGRDEAHVEIRWSSKAGFVQNGKVPGNLQTLPQRSVFTLVRQSGAKTPAQNGMSTNRCPNCNAPLTDTLTTTCDYCGAELSSGAQDWVLDSALTFEAWAARERERVTGAVAGRQAQQQLDGVWDVEERSRLLYMMAMMAAADGVVDPKERKLLKMCSDRWRIPWNSVENALQLGGSPDAFERLVPRGSKEAEAFLHNLVQLALIDGKIDRQERRMLESAAQHLGVSDRLASLLPA